MKELLFLWPGGGRVCCLFMGMRRINGTSGGYSGFVSVYQPQHCVELVQVWVEIEGISALQAGSKKIHGLES